MTIIGFGLSLGSVRKGDGTVTVPDDTPQITLDALPRDQLIFDSGAAIGQAEADIPLSGTAPAGQVIEARAITQTGTPTTGWITVATTGGGGNWAGTLSAVPRGTDWLRAQVRPAGAISVQVTSAERFAVGHVIALWGQSENARFYVRTPTTPAVALSDPEALQVIHGNRPDLNTDTVIDVQHVFVDDTTANNTLIEMSNVLAAERPGEKFAVIMQTKSGTGWFDVFDDDLDDRNFSTDQAIHAYATVNGLTKVGIVTSSWFNSNRGAGLDYEELFFPVMFGVTAAGDPVTAGVAVDYKDGAQATYDHLLSDLYDYTHTRWITQGPHRFDPVGAAEIMVSGLLTAQDGMSSNALAYEQCRISWREATQNTNGFFVGGPGPDLTFMQNGEGDAEAWTDTTHPATNDPDGLQMLAKQMMHGVLRGAGLTSWAVPVFDSFAVAPDGAYVDWWSSAGPVTTARKARNLAALDPATQTNPGDFTHWTEVMGIEINDRWAERTEIVDDQGNPAPAGRVRIYPNGSGPFRAADVIRFGRGYASPIKFEAPDSYNKTYLNLPIVDLGLSHVDGVAVSALPAPPNLTSVLSDASIPATGHAITGISNGAFAFRGPNIPANTTAVTVEAFLRIPDSAALTPGFESVLDAQGDAWEVEIQAATQAARFKVRDTTGASLFGAAGTPDGAIPIGRWFRLRLAFDTAAGWAKVFVDDTLVAEETFAPGAALATSRYPRFALSNVDFGTYELWYAAQTDGGTDTLGPAFKTIEGDAAAIAGDPWRTADGTITSTTYFGQDTFAVTADVAIAGTPGVGETLTAVPATAVPDDGARSYQWRRDGTDIAGATAASYTVQSVDGGTDLTVTETMTKAGYAAAISTSSAVSIPAGQTGTLIDMTAEATTAAAFQGPSIPANTSTLTIDSDMMLPDPSTSFLVAFRGTSLAWDISFRPSRGAIRFTLRDDTNFRAASSLSTPDNAFDPAAAFNFRFVADLVGQAARIYVNDVQVGAWTLAANSGAFNPVRVPQVAAGGFRMTLLRYRQWYEAAPDFSTPTSAPVIDLQGDAATLDASSWRTGSGVLS